MLRKAENFTWAYFAPKMGKLRRRHVRKPGFVKIQIGRKIWVVPITPDQFRVHFRDRTPGRVLGYQLSGRQGWLYEGDWYWDRQGLSPEAALAVLMDQRLRQEAKIERARMNVEWSMRSTEPAFRMPPVPPTTNAVSISSQPTWRAAEHLAEQWMRELGFADARVTMATSDRGVDVLASNAVAQVKMQANATQRPDIQRLRGAAFNVEHAIFYSFSGYSSGATTEADACGIALFAIRDNEPVAYNRHAIALVRSRAARPPVNLAKIPPP